MYCIVTLGIATCEFHSLIIFYNNLGDPALLYQHIEEMLKDYRTLEDIVQWGH